MAIGGGGGGIHSYVYFPPLRMSYSLRSSQVSRKGGGSHSVTTILALYKPRRHFSPSLAIIVHRLIAAGEACIMGNAHSRPHSLRCVPSPPPFHFVILCPAKGIPPHPFLFRLRRRLALERDSINKVDDVRTGLGNEPLCVHFLSSPVYIF